MPSLSLRSPQSLKQRVRSYQCLPHQLEFIRDTKTRSSALVGGFGSGKTKSLLLKTIDLSALNAGYKGALYAPTNELAVDILVPELDELLEQLKIPCKFKASPRPVYTLHFKHGSTLLYIRSFENYKRIIGQNLAFAGVDEIDTMKPEVARWAWQKLMGRIRSGRVNQLYTTSTPEGFKFLYQYFFKEAEGKTDRRLIRAKTTDNPFLPATFVSDLYENYPEQLVKAYVNGEFVNLTSGTVYYGYDRTLNRSDRLAKDEDALHIGADFNVGRMAATVHVMEGDRADCVSEFSGIFDTPDLIRAIQNRYPAQCAAQRVYIYPDASGGARKTVNASTSDLILLRQAGFAVYAPAANPAIKDRVASVNLRLCNGEGLRRYFVNDQECPRTAEALEQQVYDSNGMPDKSGGLDHQVDSLGYFLHYHYPIASMTGFSTTRARYA